MRTIKQNAKMILLLAGIAFVLACNNKEDAYQEVFYFEMVGDELKRPSDYRQWVYVGTPLTPNDLNDGKAAFPEFHNVYIDPASYNYWKANGTWREGTILVKELVSVGDKSAPSGKGYFMGEYIGLEATIKSKKYFPNEPGNWSYFSFTNAEGNYLKDRTKAFATNQCNTCHQSNAQDDFVFTQFYPVLRSAKNIGEGVVPESQSERKPTRTIGIWEPTVPTPEDLDIGMPLDKEGLFAFLNSKAYKNFTLQEKDKHSSEGPHTKLGLPVKVFMNDVIATSLKANPVAEVPMGSIVIKEMYDESENLSGWAVMVKTQEKTDEGKGWFWYEVSSTIDVNAIPAMGNGVIGCFSCHATGNQDMIRTSYPFRN